MSTGFVALPKIILQNPNLTPDAIVLYCHLLHFDRQGTKHGCIARRETLSKLSNLSLHKIRGAITKLEAEGIISVIRRRNSLTDRIRINPDCRPQINKSKVPSTAKTNLSTPQERVDRCGTTRSKPLITQEIKDFNVSSIKNNKNSINNIRTEDSTVLDFKEKDIPPMKDPHQYYLRRCTLTLRYQIKKVIRPQSFKSIFSNSWVVHEDPQSIKLAIPGTDDIVDLAQETYGTKIQSLTGKSVEIVSESALTEVHND